MKETQTIGIDLLMKKPTPEEWEKMKDGFTQAHGCKNCENRWSEQLEWNGVAVNHVIMHDYCSDCYPKGKE